MAGRYLWMWLSRRTIAAAISALELVGMVKHKEARDELDPKLSDEHRVDAEKEYDAARELKDELEKDRKDRS